MDIPAGFQIVVESWENDGDSRATVTTSGLSLHDIYFLLDIIKHFDRSGKCGNNFVDDVVLESILQEAYDKHVSKVSTRIVELFYLAEPISSEGMYESLCNVLLNYPMDEGYMSMDERPFCRVVDNFKVYFFPNIIRDFTSEFVSTQ